jgi:hypothetical protein
VSHAKPSSAYLWLKAVGAEPRPPAFARVVKSSSSTTSRFVVVEVGGARVRVEAGFDGDLLRSASRRPLGLAFGAGSLLLSPSDFALAIASSSCSCSCFSSASRLSSAS